MARAISAKASSQRSRPSAATVSAKGTAGSRSARGWPGSRPRPRRIAYPPQASMGRPASARPIRLPR
ncbi:hypothetical protein DP939_38715 [Spongiactinospora rosea]|uniref:Uncharacterized protein n=1 Tax=Spongiactinospora rosea TaxID=2248750 RepID=A0A366LNM6_9ACTN|nr:hypothetical protein [Spongiactinospora rosea]RBQ14894.1 hypothetical protein DP939_38715 [Spongiactinospora rosea]